MSNKKDNTTGCNDGASQKQSQAVTDTLLEQGQAVGSEQKKARRSLLKNTLIGGGAVISTGLIADKWKKPILDAVILPSHAQTSSAAVVMGGGTGILVTKADNKDYDAGDILGLFVTEANAANGELAGGCVLLTIEGSVATVQMTLNTGAVDTKTGTVSGTTVNVSGLHSGYTVSGTLNSATSPTSCNGTVSGFGESGGFSVSSADPVCAAITPPTTTSTPTSTSSPTTTSGPTTTSTPTTTAIPTTAIPTTAIPTTAMPTTPMPTTPMPTTPMPNANVSFNFSLSKSYWS